ncbi:MAG: DUF951 domain-containing protein [Anaerolineae bacterium]|nr:DUF951 domain-containing protein [Anaerolineae bacterium]
MRPPLEIHLGDIVRLRKAHPCGSYEWEVVRVGADIRLRCCRCGRRVLLPRQDLQRHVKEVLPGSPTP